jgi:ribose 5-phosphate isomerase B
MKLAVGSDHMGYELKLKLLGELAQMGHEVMDFGSFDPEPVDFPDIAKLVCRAILKGDCQRGIIFCGSGAGAAIACNKVPGIRASVCHDIFTAHQCVEHDDVQVIAVGGQIIGYTVAKELIRIFLDAEFSSSEEFCRRVAKLEHMADI